MGVPASPKTLQDAILFFADPVNCREYLVARRWANGVECPRCGSKNVLFLERYSRWHCREKHQAPQFTLKTGTIMEDSPLGLDKWLTVMWLLGNCSNGISSYQISRAMKITQKTAWFLLSRIRLGMQDELNGGNLGGEAEVDETYIGGKTRERRGEFLEPVEAWDQRSLRERGAVPSISLRGRNKNSYSTNRGPMDEGDRFRYVVRKIVGKRLTYAELTGKTEAGSESAEPL